MGAIKIQTFSAERPKLSAHLLPLEGAQVAQNTKLIRGSLAPWKAAAATSMNLGSSVKTLHRTNAGRFIGWNLDVSVARSTVPGDALERIFWTGDGAPKMASVSGFGSFGNAALISGMPANTVFALGIPAATSAPVLYPSGGPASPTNPDALTRQYLTTFVSVFGEESAPSPISAEVIVLDGQSVQVDTTAPAGAPPNITGKRLYRTDVNGLYRLVNTEGDLVASSLTYIDNKLDSALGEQLKTEGWAVPPSTLQGMKAGPNGVLAGFFGNTLAFSEPYAPYAWPVEYQFTTDYNIVAICATSGGFLVATEGTPYFAMGSFPASMSLSRIDQQQACVSAQSMVDMGDYAIYASPDGLVAAQGGDVQLISKESITRDQWQAIKPDSIRAYLYQGQYFGFYDTGSTQGGFMFDPTRQDFVWFNFYAKAGTTHLLTDTLWLYVGSAIAQWDAGADLSYTWKSRRNSMVKATNLSSAWVDAATYPVTFKLYADGVLMANLSVADRRPFRLPAGFRATVYEIQLEGTAEVYQVAIGHDMQDVVNV